MENKKDKIADKIATRKIEAYLMLKVPVGYSLMRNARALLQNQLGFQASDEDMEEIFARFLDLVIFGLMRDSDQLGGAFPSPEHFYEVVKEVQLQKQMEEQPDAGFYDQFRFDDTGSQDPYLQGQEQQAVDPRMQQVTKRF